jgi:hypothetical protein
MIWDGKSKGTLLNVHRLVESAKSVVVYFSPSRECRAIKTQADLRILLSRCPQSERRRHSGLLDLGPEQATLFPAMGQAFYAIVAAEEVPEAWTKERTGPIAPEIATKVTP